MKLLFVHDSTLKYDKNGVYYGQEITPASLERYKFFTDDITVVARTEALTDNEDVNRYTKITDEYKVVGVPNYMSVKGLLFVKNKVKKQISRLVEEHDIVVARFSGKTGKMAAAECKKQKKVYIIECGTCWWDSLWNYNLKGKIIAPWEYLNTRFAINKAPYVVYVTQKFLQKRYPTKGKWISASNVELKSMSIDALNNRKNKIAGKGKEEPVILGTAAAIDVQYKGQAYVIQAMAMLKKEGYRFKYQLAGKGDKERLYHLAKSLGVEEDVEFLGIMPHDKVFEWLDGIDIYIQPSSQEGLPRSIIEAMSRACPAIGTTAGGMGELLDDSCIFKKKNTGELVEILKTMDQKKQAIMAERNFNMALKYERDKIQKTRFEFYQEIIDREFKKI